MPLSPDEQQALWDEIESRSPTKKTESGPAPEGLWDEVKARAEGSYQPPVAPVAAPPVEPGSADVSPIPDFGGQSVAPVAAAPAPPVEPGSADVSPIPDFGGRAGSDLMTAGKLPGVKEAVDQLTDLGGKVLAEAGPEAAQYVGAAHGWQAPEYTPEEKEQMKAHLAQQLTGFGRGFLSGRTFGLYQPPELTEEQKKLGVEGIQETAKFLALGKPISSLSNLVKAEGVQGVRGSMVTGLIFDLLYGLGTKAGKAWAGQKDEEGPGVAGWGGAALANYLGQPEVATQIAKLSAEYRPLDSALTFGLVHFGFDKIVNPLMKLFGISVGEGHLPTLEETQKKVLRDDLLKAFQDRHPQSWSVDAKTGEIRKPDPGDITLRDWYGNLPQEQRIEIVKNSQTAADLKAHAEKMGWEVVPGGEPGAAPGEQGQGPGPAPGPQLGLPGPEPPAEAGPAAATPKPEPQGPLPGAPGITEAAPTPPVPEKPITPAGPLGVGGMDIAEIATAKPTSAPEPAEAGAGGVPPSPKAPESPAGPGPSTPAAPIGVGGGEALEAATPTPAPPQAAPETPPVEPQGVTPAGGGSPPGGPQAQPSPPSDLAHQAIDDALAKAAAGQGELPPVGMVTPFPDLVAKYGGLYTEKTPAPTPAPTENVAPEPSGEAISEPPAPTHSIYTSEGTEIPVKYAVHEIGTLSTSHDNGMNQNPDFPPAYQNRDRDRAASIMQVGHLEKNFNPELAGANPLAESGAPVIGQDGIVESGNARTIALRRAYQYGGERSAAYKSWLVEHAADFGLDPQAVQGMKRPILVQQRTQDMDPAARENLVKEMNRPSVAPMSATEIAAGDAQGLKKASHILNSFTPNAEGEILTADNRAFIRAFMENVVGPSQIGKYFDKAGNINQEGITRIRNALFAGAYGDTPALGKLAESTSDESRNVTGTLATIAPRVMQANEKIVQGKLHDLSISQNLSDAARLLQTAKESGQAVKEFITQGGLFGNVDDVTKDILTIFDDFSRSRKKLASVFNNYYEALEKLGNPKQIRLMGDTIPTRAEILQAAIRRMEEQHGIPAKTQPGAAAGGGTGPAAAPKAEEVKAPAGAQNTEEVKPKAPKSGIAGATPKPKPVKYELGDIVRPKPDSGMDFIKGDVVVTHIQTDADGKQKLKVRRQGSAGNGGGHFNAENFDLVSKAAPEAAPAAKGSPHAKIAEWVSDMLARNEVINSAQLFNHADDAYDGTMAQGKYSVKEAYDALELGVNQYIRSHPDLYDPHADDPKEVIGRLEELIKRLPTQSKRTGEMEEFQQFSTPPPLAYTVAWVANISSQDIALEPSGGTGDLVVMAQNAGAKEVIANELSKRRADLLRELGIKVFTENAEQLHNILPANVKPTVVVMNPPFSSTAGRMMGKRTSMNVTSHLGQALKRLEPDGRLVAIVGRGMDEDLPTFKIWWTKIKKDYNVLANVGISGKNYAKYGTTFDNRILVIDKTGPTANPVITGDVENLADLVDLLQGVKDERLRPELAENPEAQPGAAPEQAGATGAPVGGSEAAPKQPVSGAATGVGPGEKESEAGRPTAAAGVSSGEPVKAGDLGPGNGNGGVRAGQRGEPRQPGAPGPDQPDTTGDRGGGTVSQPTGGGGAVPGSDVSDVRVEGQKGNEQPAEFTDSIYEPYKPERLKIPGAQPHPGNLVQSAAMASVSPPHPTYQPKISQKVIDSGKLSEAQLEPIVYAGQAHQEILPNGWRQGFFIGDGTGVGKGREIAGIIQDNWNQGRKKALWISDKADLAKAAKRDVKGIGMDPDLVFELRKIKTGNEIKTSQGIMFLSYDRLKSSPKVNKEAKKAAEAVGAPPPKAPPNTLDQIVQWLGPDFDGVIAFDESHKMGNAVQVRAGRGTKQPSMRALKGIELQRALPKARIIYVSATGATEVMNLAYAERLGLWGEGTSFPTRASFISQINSGGVAAMELVARDMKAMGLYTARSLAFDVPGNPDLTVTYDRLEHVLEPHQREIYDELARAWQLVLQNIRDALKETDGNKDSQAKSSAYSQFWGTHQRFFNQVLTSMQMPSVLKSIRTDLAAGHAPILQLVNTFEASQERALGKLTEDQSLDELDLTPRDSLMQFIERSFPTQQYELYTNDDGNEKSRPVFDSLGNPVQNAKAVRMKEELLNKLGSLRVPDGPLDMLLNAFGSDAVAEVTGRKRRVVRFEGESKIEKRSDSKAEADIDAFMNDMKQMLVFSDKGGTGRSYHADLDTKNQRKRIHYLVQAGWRADNAIQGFGRSHRSNERSAPQYVLVHTDLKGQKRFLSSIARRLDQLGALTKGQRQAGSSGIFQAQDNLESQEARDALTQFYMDLVDDKIPGITVGEFQDQTGLKLLDDHGSLLMDLPPITQFLNRLLSMEVDMQNRTFDAFADRLVQAVERAALMGTLDQGIETLKADPGGRIEKAEERTVHTDERTGAETKFVKLNEINPTKTVSWNQVDGNYYRGHYLNVRSGKIWARAREAFNRTDESGRVKYNYLMQGTTARSKQMVELEDITEAKWRLLKKEDAQRIWNEQVAGVPKEETHPINLITGTVLPVWERLKGDTRVVRVQTKDGERFVGRVIPRKYVTQVLNNLGAGPKVSSLGPQEVFNQILDGESFTLANGWRLKRSKVSNDDRIELIGPDYGHLAELEKAGVFTERINYSTRYFVGLDDGPANIAKIIKNRPIVNPEAGTAGHAAEPLASYGPKANKMQARLDELQAEYPDIDREKAALVLRTFPKVENPQVAAMSADQEMFNQVARGNLSATEQNQLFKKASDKAQQKSLFSGGEMGKPGGGWLFEKGSPYDLTPAQHKEEVKIAYGSEKAAGQVVKEVARKIDSVHRRLQGIPSSGVPGVLARYKSRIAQEYSQDGWVDLSGQQLEPGKEAQQIAELFQVFRNPKMEVLHAIFTKDGMIVAHNAISSGQINYVKPENVARYLYKIRQTAERLEADKVHLLHNHPSGNPEMSMADRGLATIFKDGFMAIKTPVNTHASGGAEGRPPGYKNQRVEGLGDLTGEFVVIDHGKFSYLYEYPGQGQQINYGDYKVSPELRQVPAKRIQMKTTGDLAAFVSTLKYDPNKVLLIHVSNHLEVNGWSIHNKEILDKSPKEVKAIFKQEMKAFDGARVAVVTDAKDLVEKLLAQEINYKPSVNGESIASFVLDILDGNGNSLKGKASYLWEFAHGQAKKVAHALWEPQATYTPGQQPGSPSWWERWKNRVAPGPTKGDLAINKWIGKKDVAKLENTVVAGNRQRAIMKALGRTKFDAEAKKVDEALTHYVELKKYPSHLHKYYKDLKPRDQEIVDLSQTIGQNPALKAIADDMRARYDMAEVEARAAGVIHDHRDAFMAHIWDLSKAPSTEGQRKFGTTTGHARQRVFKTEIQGLAAKYTPLVRGATNKEKVYHDDLAHTIADKNFVKSENRKVGIFTSKQGAEGKTDLLLHPNMKGWRWAGSIEVEPIIAAVRRMSEEVRNSSSSSSTVKGGPASAAVGGGSKPLQAMKEVIRTSLTARGMTEGEAEAYINRVEQSAINRAQAAAGAETTPGTPPAEKETTIIRELKEKIVKIEESQKVVGHTFTPVLRKDLFIDGEGNIFQKTPLYAEPDVAAKLNNIQGTSALRKIPGVDKVLKVANSIKETILFLTGYHHQAGVRAWILGVTGQGLKGLNIRQTYRKGLQMINDLDPVIRHGVEVGGLNLGITTEWREELNRHQSKIGRVLDGWKVSKDIKNQVHALWDAQVNFLFGKLFPGLQAMMYVAEFKNGMKKFPGSNPDEMARAVAELSNYNFGNLNYARMGRNPTLQDIFRAVFLAPQWTESNYKPVAEMVKAFKEGDKARSYFYRKFWASIILKGISALLIGNLMLGLGDDKSSWDRLKMAWKAGRLRWLGWDITPIYQGIYKAMGWEPGKQRKYFSPLGHFLDALKMVTHPLLFLHHKGSPLYRFFHEAMVGHNWKDQPYTSIGDILGYTNEGQWKGKYVKEGKSQGPVTPGQLPSFLVGQARGSIPIMGGNLVAWLGGEMDGFDALSKSSGSMVSSFTPKSDAQDLINEYYQNVTPQVKSAAQRERNELKKSLLETYRKGDEDGFRDGLEYAMDSGKISHQEAQEWAHEAALPKGVSQFTRLPMEMAIKVLGEATDEEKALWMPYFLHKVAHANPETVLHNQGELEGVLRAAGADDTADVVANLTKPNQLKKLDIPNFGDQELAHANLLEDLGVLDPFVAGLLRQGSTKSLISRAGLGASRARLETAQKGVSLLDKMMGLHG